MSEMFATQETVLTHPLGGAITVPRLHRMQVDGAYNPWNEDDLHHTSHATGALVWKAVTPSHWVPAPRETPNPGLPSTW